MFIEKIINNNIVSAYDSKGKEVIVMGKGIGFSRKRGDKIDENKIEKIFKITENELLIKLQDLLSDIPIEHIKIVDKIIKYAIDTHGFNLSQTIYLTLIDHVHFAIERYAMGLYPTDTLIWDIKRAYKQEYEIGKYSIELINKYLSISLPESEASLIALHFVNAQYGTSMNDIINLPKLIRDILDIVQSELKIALDENSIHFERFLTHVKFLFQRIYKNEQLSSSDCIFENMVKREYPLEYSCGKRIANYIENETKSRLSEEEIIYLAIHIKRVTMTKE